MNPISSAEHEAAANEALDTAASAPAPSSRIFGSGEMADLTRAFNWAGTSLGPVDQWPDTLLTLVNTILGSRHPMFLWWGPDLIQFYNDAYRPSIREDKHPRALGKKGRECWGEIWHLIGPQIDAVMSRGEASWNEDHLVPIFRNGKLEDVYWTYGYSPVRDAAGHICATLVVCTETTATVLARRQLQRGRQRLADLFEQAPAFFAVLDGPDFVYEMINPPYQELIGNRNVLGRPVREALPEVEAQGFVEILGKVYRTGEPFIGHNTPVHLARRGGDPLELRYLNFVYQPRRDAYGAITGVIVLGVDVTEGRRAEQLLVQSEKLAAAGRLASSIAHEINNPLESVTNLIYLAQNESTNPVVKGFLATAEIELRRVSAIASQTLRFHRQTTHPREIQPVEMIDATLLLYQGRFVNCMVDLTRRYRALRSITCFDGEMRQVLSNLIGNAIDALPFRGRLIVRTRDATHWPTGRQGVLITIADSGSGMTPATIARIFEPFFTTKGINGTGLGLWVSREIVARHQGILRARSRHAAHNSGTVFQLFLPSHPVGLSGPSLAPRLER